MSAFFVTLIDFQTGGVQIHWSRLYPSTTEQTVFGFWAVTKYIHQIKEQIKTSFYFFKDFLVFLRLVYTKRPVYLLDNKYSLKRAYLYEEMMRAFKWLETHALFARSTIY